MEFHEKLQQLRRGRGLTQEELAEALYVSRTAVSKWESGRGYPSIDSLKEISAFFSVSIDDLLSGDKLISVAEKENRENIRNMCGMLSGIADILSFVMIVLPLYPKTVEGYVFSVNLMAYTQATLRNRSVYWAMYILLILTGILKILPIHEGKEKLRKCVTVCSMIIGVSAVIILALAGETYAVMVIFLLLMIKGMLLFRCAKAG